MPQPSTGPPFFPPFYSGASYVVLGTDAFHQGSPTQILLEGRDPCEGSDRESEAAVLIEGAADYDRAGRSVSGAGDFSGDGLDDLIIGAPYADPIGRTTAGATYVVFGSRDMPATIDLATEADVVIEGGAAGDRSGWSVSEAGDVDGDGFHDVIIGERDGVSYVAFGGPVAATERLIGRVEAADLSGGLQNSLTSKLNSALGLLARGQTTGAISKVGDFIGQVEAQSGKQVDEADADLWIAAAETILDMLSTPDPASPPPILATRALWRASAALDGARFNPISPPAHQHRARGGTST